MVLGLFLAELASSMGAKHEQRSISKIQIPAQLMKKVHHS